MGVSLRVNAASLGGFYALEVSGSPDFAIVSILIGGVSVGDTLKASSLHDLRVQHTSLVNSSRQEMVLAEVHLFPISRTEAHAYLAAPLFGGGIAQGGET